MNAIKTAFQPGEGKTGALGYLSSALGVAGENQLRKRAELESDALGVDVASKERILERAAVMPEISRMGLDETQRKIEQSEQEDASTLATLIESGMSPAEANNVLSQNRDNRTSAMLTQLNQMDALQNQQNANQKALTDAAFADLEGAKVAQEQFDILGQDKANTDFLFAMGTQASNLEGLINPQAAALEASKKEKTRGSKLAERGYKHGGITPGPHDHDVLNLVISHEDGTPALDGDGDEMHVTGSEAIIPDYIFEELMAAAKAGDKNALFEIFMDEIATEERFQV